MATEAETELMKKTATNFEDVDKALQKMLNDLMDRLEQTKGYWAGQSARSFDSVKISFNGQLTKLSGILRETANGIRTAGQNYSSADIDLSNTVSAIKVPDLPL